MRIGFIALLWLAGISAFAATPQQVTSVLAFAAALPTSLTFR